MSNHAIFVALIKTLYYPKAYTIVLSCVDLPQKCLQSYHNTETLEKKIVSNNPHNSLQIHAALSSRSPFVSCLHEEHGPCNAGARIHAESVSRCSNLLTFARFYVHSRFLAVQIAFIYIDVSLIMRNFIFYALLQAFTSETQFDRFLTVESSNTSVLLITIVAYYGSTVNGP